MTSPDEPSPTDAPAVGGAAKADASNGEHDRIFRHAFSLPVVARQFLRRWLPPELVRQTDWHTLGVSRISGISDTLSERREDVVYRIRMEGREVHFYVLLEHQTKSEKYMARRILEEILFIWRQDEHDRAGEEAAAKVAAKAGKSGRGSGKLPLVISMVLHPGPGKWGKIWRLADLIDVPPGMEKWARTFMPDCGFIVVELAGLPLEKLADGALARAILGALQGNRLGLMDIRKIKRLLDETFADPDRVSIGAVINQLWHYLISSSDLKHEQIEGIVTDTIPKEYKTTDIMNTVERLRQEGRQEGLQEGQHNAVIEALEVRFARVPEGLQEA
ncbi:MAG: Rpn family recombination-promoting nuclease/putative transposase, partial [Opitutaceae bacterium]|nr:Rpn family recombination-promoting nuclease/putative transposase [Opitutaceae bacterium]